MFLYIDEKQVDHKELPSKIEWRQSNKSFLLGTYAWPTPYDVLYYKGIIDDLKFIPKQERLSETRKTLKKNCPG